MKTWHAFAFLIITAVAYYGASGPIPLHCRRLRP